MQFLKAYLKYCFLVLILLTQISISAEQQSLQELKNRISGDVFPHEILEDYEFYILNNKIEFNQELKFLSELNQSYETQYLQSLVLFKNNNFDESFNKLYVQLIETPDYYPYYNLLSKTASITNNESKIENKLEQLTSKKYKNYLEAHLSYQKSKYEDAKEKFNLVLVTDSTSFETLYMIAYSSRNLGDYDSAFKYFNKASSLLKKDNPLVAKVTIAIGSLFYLSGNYENAKEAYNTGLKKATEFGFTSERIKALINLGMILDEEGAIEKARFNFDKASELAAIIGDNELEAISLSEYAVSYTYTGEIVNAREKYEKSFSLFEKLKNKNRFAFTAINIGHIYLNVSNYKSAIKYYEIGLNEAGENVRTKMLALRGLGDVYTNLLNYSKALDYYKQAKELAKQIKDVAANAKINIGLGILYYNLDMPQKAIKILGKSQSSLSESGNPYLKLEIEQKIGIIYSSLDSLNLAHSYLQNSSKLATKYGDIYSEIISNTFLAEAMIRQNDLSSAYSSLKATIATTTDIELNQLLGVQNLLMSDIYKLKEDDEAQVKYIEQAIFHAEQSFDFYSQIEANHRLGEIYEHSGQLADAEDYYKKAINLVELNFNHLFKNADIQIKFFSNFYSIYNSLINLYLSEDNFVKAFEILKKSKARNTNQNLVNLKFDKSEVSQKLLDEYYDLTWKLSSELYSKDELTSIENLFNEVKESISLIDSETAKQINSITQFSIEDIKSNLEKNQYLISYYVQQNNLYAFQLSIDGLEAEKLNISTKQIDELKNNISPYYDNKVGGNEISFNKDLFAFNADGAKNFYQNIVQPITKNIPKNSKIIFSLPSEMITIPFELLVTQSSDEQSPYILNDKKFLIDDYIISYTPSVAIWNELHNRNNSNNEIALLIGDPIFENGIDTAAETRGLTDEIDLFSRNMEHQRLEYSEEEIQSIGSLLSNDHIYLSKDATETAFKKNAEDASLVHLSTHSFLYKNNPLILFSNTDKENDGFLEVGEILNLHLKSDMVVLSSCKSGLGRVDKAEGIIGMQKAFFDAGAKSVVVSLWDVNDKYTSIFMKYFYSFLSEGYSKSESLRFAKLKFIKLNNSNPYYWSAFTISGNDKPIRIQIRSHTFVFTLTGIFLTLFITIYYLYKRKFRSGLLIRNV
jgi:CHAT domain-containing protein/Tfp pilus assembly protein PilF